MKIAVGTEEKKLDTLLSKKFGQAKYYILYDTKDKSFEIIENIDPDDRHAPLQDLVKKGADSFIVSYIGPKAFEVLHAANKKVFHAKNISVLSAIEKLLKNELEELKEPNVKKSMAHHH